MTPTPSPSSPLALDPENKVALFCKFCGTRGTTGTIEAEWPFIPLTCPGCGGGWKINNSGRCRRALAESRAPAIPQGADPGQPAAGLDLERRCNSFELAARVMAMQFSELAAELGTEDGNFNALVAKVRALSAPSQGPAEVAKCQVLTSSGPGPIELHIAGLEIPLTLENAMRLSRSLNAAVEEMAGVDAAVEMSRDADEDEDYNPWDLDLPVRHPVPAAPASPVDGDTLLRLACDLARAEKQYRECPVPQKAIASKIMEEAGDRIRNLIDPPCQKCGGTRVIGRTKGYDGEAYEIDCPECLAGRGYGV